MKSDDDTPQTDEQPADSDQPTEQADEQPAVIDMEPEEITVDKPVMQRIQEIADVSPGNEGIRIRRMLAIESLADPYQSVPGSGQKDRLWYYNPGAVSYYIQLHTTNASRKEMTKDTDGQFPFDGDMGPGFEQTRHDWRDEIYKSWQEMANVEGHFALGGGSALGPLVDAFLKHVHDLADTPTHLYYIYQHDDDDT